jgi:rare lipoprotein A
MPFAIRALFSAAAVVVSLAVFAGGASAETGRASWYSLTSKTASGERCDPSALTAAHRSLPFGTKVKVENLKNGRSVVVRINDRGPFVAGRIIDLTKAAAGQLGFVSHGITQVRLTVLQRG